LHPNLAHELELEQTNQPTNKPDGTQYNLLEITNTTAEKTNQAPMLDVK